MGILKNDVDVGDYLLNFGPFKRFKHKIYRVVDKYMLKENGLTEIQIASLDNSETFSYPLMFLEQDFVNVGDTPSIEVLYGCKSKDNIH